jgi:hypothetical protein
MMTWGETDEHDGVGRVDAELRGRRAPAQPHEAREQGRPAQSRAAVRAGGRRQRGSGWRHRSSVPEAGRWSAAPSTAAPPP